MKMCKRLLRIFAPESESPIAVGPAPSSCSVGRLLVKFRPVPAAEWPSAGCNGDGNQVSWWRRSSRSRWPGKSLALNSGQLQSLLASTCWISSSNYKCEWHGPPTQLFFLSQMV